MFLHTIYTGINKNHLAGFFTLLFIFVHEIMYVLMKKPSCTMWSF